MSTQVASNGHVHAELAERAQGVLNPTNDFEIRHALLGEWLFDDRPAAREALEQFLNRAATAAAEEVVKLKQQELDQMIELLKAGTLRPATYVGALHAPGSPPRIRVRTPSGDDLSSLVPDETLRKSLQCGDTVWLDAQGRAAICKQDEPFEAGEVVRFERRHDARRILVTVHEHDSQVMLVGAALAQRIANDEIVPGAKLLANLKQQFVFEALDEEGAGRFRFLSREPLADIRLDRDVGDPPAFVSDVLEHVDRELTSPEVGRRYRIRRAQTKLLAGVSGSGKTLSIEATIRAAMERVAARVGVSVEALPPRVMRLRMATVGSMWFGQTDKNIDRFFDEALELSDQKFVAPDGREHDLPLFLIIEEADSLGMSRGGEETYSRIQGTLLQRLDANSRRLGEKFVIVLATTNVGHLLDPAVLRRLGGTVERFGRLSRNGCAAVLAKHLAGLPLPASYGDGPTERERHAIRELLAWLFGQAGDDPDQVEVTYVGSAGAVGFRRRAFLTGGLIDRAVQQACQAACRRDRDDSGEAGVGIELLIEALDAQVRAIVEQLSEHNVGNFLTLPHGVRVAQVRRLDPPPLTRRDLRRRDA